MCGKYTVYTESVELQGIIKSREGSSGGTCGGRACKGRNERGGVVSVREGQPMHAVDGRVCAARVGREGVVKVNQWESELEKSSFTRLAQGKKVCGGGPQGASDIQGR